MGLFERLTKDCDELSKIAQDYLDSLPFIDNGTVCERIWDWAVSQLNKDESGIIIFNGKNDLAETIVDEGIPYATPPKNGSLHYALGWSVTAQEANLRSLLEFIEGRQPEWGKFQCLAKLRPQVITEKNVKSNDKEHAHTDIFCDGIYLGYIIKDKSKYRTIGKNWVFVSKHEQMPYIYKETQIELKKEIELKAYELLE